MAMINQLKLKSKLLFLFFLIFFGVTSISILGYMNISSMKKNLDLLYFGSFIPVNELNTINLEYHQNIKNNIVLILNYEISPDVGSANIRKSLQIIEKEFSKYTAHFKRDEELSYIGFAEKKLKKMDQYFGKVIIFLLNEESQFDQFSVPMLVSKIDEIDNVIEKLLIYEKNMAQYERKMLLITYDNTLFQVSIIISIILGLVLYLAYAIFESIRRHQKYLESSAKKLRENNIKLEQSSYTDTLTTLHNRRYFNMVFSRELKRAKRNKSNFTFMMVDIDFFKQYNDFYGHLEGDKALKSVALSLKQTLLRPCDFIFRLGGEEFGIIVCETDTENSGFLAQRIIDKIDALRLKHEKSSVSSHLSVSIGVLACVPNIGLKDDEIIKKADDNLYLAKDTGRNKYIISEEV